MARGFRRFSVFTAVLLSVLTSMSLIAGPANAADIRTVYPFYDKPDCNVERTTYKRYYDDVSLCKWNPYGYYWFFTYDYNS
jgi:hypothetical protein